MSRRKKQPITLDIPLIGAALPTALNYTDVAGATGAAKGDHYELALAVADEEQVAELNFNDLLGIDIDDVQYVDIWAELDDDLAANEQLVVGLGSARNNDARSVAERAIFTVDGGSTTVKVNTDDGTTDTSHTSNMTLTKDVVTMFRIDLKQGQQQIVGANSKAGKGSIQFECSNNQGQLNQVQTPGKHMDASGYSGGLQPIIQLRKASGTSTNKLKVYRIRIQMLANG